MKSRKRFQRELLTGVNISPLTEFVRTTKMAFSGEDEAAITIDGYAQVLMTPYGGSEAVIGCVAPDLEASAPKITRDLTTGVPMVGADQKIAGTLAQTKPADIANMVGAIALSKIKVIGAVNTATITAPSGRKIWMNFDLSIKFSNKADSGMKFEVIKPGQTVSSLTSFITASS
jgi:hypothetical protein